MFPNSGGQGAQPAAIQAGYDLSGIGLLAAMLVVAWVGIAMLGRPGAGAKAGGTALLVLAGWWAMSGRGLQLFTGDVPAMQIAFRNWLSGVGAGGNPGSSGGAGPGASLPQG